jgi:hypothetical protein
VDWLNTMARDFYRDLYALLEEGREAGVFEFGDARDRAFHGRRDWIHVHVARAGTHGPETLAQELARNMMKLVLPN